MRNSIFDLLAFFSHLAMLSDLRAAPKRVDSRFLFLSPWLSGLQSGHNSRGDAPSDSRCSRCRTVRLSQCPSDRCTVVWIHQEYRRKYRATRSSVRSFARTAHSVACSGLLASLAPSAALTRSLARSLCSLPRSLTSLTPSLLGQ